MTATSMSSFPTLSGTERERRHTLVRDLLGRLEHDGLLAFGDDRNPVDNWLTNDRPGNVVVFPRAGEVTSLVWSTQVVAAHILATARGEDEGVRDLRRGMGGAAIVKALREKGLDRGRLGQDHDAQVPHRP